MKRLCCFMLAVLLAVLCCGCSMRGNTLVLDTYSPQALYNTYCAIQDGTLKVSVNRAEKIPSVHTLIVDNSELSPNRASLYFYNDKESSFYVSIHGYAWVTQSDEPAKKAHKAIYFNSETEVANSGYEIRLDPARNTYLSYELIDGTEHNPDKNTLYFIFFLHEETEFVGAVTKDNFVFWPLEQTLKK